MLKGAAKLTCLIAIGVTGHSQEVITPSIFKPNNYWGICLTPVLLAKADINGDKEKYQLHSLPQIGGELLVNYYYNFRPQYYLVFGAGINASAYNFNYYVPKEMFNPPVEFDMESNTAISRESGIFNFRLQFEIQRKWPNAQTKNWDLAVGTSLLFSSSIDWDMTDNVMTPGGQFKAFLTRTNDYSNDGKPWFNFHIAGGHEWSIKEKNIFQLNLKLNYSPTNFVTGTYLFTTGIPPDLSGTYTLSGSYLGLSLAYLFGKTQKD